MGLLVWEKYYENGRLPGNTKKGSFCLRDILKHLDMYKGLARDEINNGKTCYLWEELWGMDILSQKFLELFSFAKKKQIVFAEGHVEVPQHSLFHLPLSHTTTQNIFRGG